MLNNMLDTETSTEESVESTPVHSLEGETNK